MQQIGDFIRLVWIKSVRSVKGPSWSWRLRPQNHKQVCFKNLNISFATSHTQTQQIESPESAAESKADTTAAPEPRLGDKLKSPDRPSVDGYRPHAAYPSRPSESALPRPRRLYRISAHWDFPARWTRPLNLRTLMSELDKPGSTRSTPSVCVHSPILVLRRERIPLLN
jgi:hypothetical protein